MSRCGKRTRNDHVGVWPRNRIVSLESSELLHEPENIYDSPLLDHLAVCDPVERHPVDPDPTAARLDTEQLAVSVSPFVLPLDGHRPFISDGRSGCRLQVR